MVDENTPKIKPLGIIFANIRLISHFLSIRGRRFRYCVWREDNGKHGRQNDKATFHARKKGDPDPYWSGIQLQFTKHNCIWVTHSF